MQQMLKLCSGLLISTLLLLTGAAQADENESTLICTIQGSIFEGLAAELEEDNIDLSLCVEKDDEDEGEEDKEGDNNDASDDDAATMDDTGNPTTPIDDSGTPTTGDNDDGDGNGNGNGNGDDVISIEIEIDLLDAETIALLDLDFFLALGFNDLTLFSPAALSGISVKQFKELPLDALIALSPEQFAALSLEVIESLTAEQLAVLSPEIIATLTPEQLELLEPETVAGFTEEQIAVLPPATVTAFTKQQMTQLSYEAVSGFSLEQFESVTVGALSGLTKDNMGGLDQDIVATMGIDILEVVDEKEVEKMSEKDITWFLFNINLINVSIDKVTQVIKLPEGWEIDKKGKIKIKGKKGKKIKIKLPKFKFKKPKESKYKVIMPSLPNLNVNLSIGGNSGDTQTTFIQQINQTLVNLNYPDFSLTQGDDGIVWVKGSGKSKGTDLSLIVDEDSFEQVEEGTPPNLYVDNNGYYVVITDTGYKCKLRPAPKNTSKLGTLLGEGSINVTKYGTTKLYIPSLNQTVIGAFDPFIYTVAAGTPPGITLKGTVGKDERIEVVYDDSTMQILRPTVLDRSGLVFARTQLPDSKMYGKYKFKANGEVHFVYGKRLMKLIPSFNIKVSYTVKQVNPVINVVNNSRYFINVDGDRQTFSIEDIGSADEFVDDEEDDDDD